MHRQQHRVFGVFNKKQQHAQEHYRTEAEAYRRFVQGERVSFWHALILAAKSCLALVEMLIRYIPGAFGYGIRYFYYKMFIKEMGSNVLIGTGVFLNGVRNISLSDYVWIDNNCQIDAMLGPVTIGRRVHIAPCSLIFARAPITVGDYVGISSFVRIYASSEQPGRGKRMSGPMVPPEQRNLKIAPVTLYKDSFVGTGSVLLPGAELGEGAVVGANSVLSRKVEPYVIVAGSPAREVCRRQAVTEADV